MYKIQPDLILIDLDGTLVDSVPDLSFCIDEMMVILGYETCGVEKVRCWVGNGVAKLVKRALSHNLEGRVDKMLYDKAYDVFLELYARNISKRSRLYEGVKEGLVFLKSRKYKLGCITNKAMKFTHPLLKNLGIFDSFELIVSGDTLAKQKPHPAPLLYAAEYFSCKPNKCLMLGDSMSDVRAARAALFHIICVSYGYNHGEDIRSFKPDSVIDSFLDLKHYLG